MDVYWGVGFVVCGVGGLLAASTNTMGWIGWAPRPVEQAKRVRLGVTSLVLIGIGAVVLVAP